MAAEAAPLVSRESVQGGWGGKKNGAAGLSRYEPDPLNALARVEAERAAKSAPAKFPPSGSPTTSSPQRGLKPNAFGSPQAPPSMSTPAASEESLALRLSDTQLDAVMRLCQPLALHCRDALLRILAHELRGRRDVGDGELHRLARTIIKDNCLFDPPTRIAAPDSMPVASSKARSRRTCRSTGRPSSS